MLIFVKSSIKKWLYYNMPVKIWTMKFFVTYISRLFTFPMNIKIISK